MTKKTAKPLLSCLLTAALMAGLCLNASAITYPNSYWPLQDQWISASEAKDPDQIISVTQRIYDLLIPYGLDQDVCYNLEPKCGMTSWAYEIKGDLDNAVLWLNRQVELERWLADNVGGYLDAIQNNEARLRYLEAARNPAIYAQTGTGTSPYAAGPRTGTWYGSPADGSRTDGSAALIYMEFGASYNADHWIEYYTETSELFRRAANGGVVEVAWNFAASTAGCQQVLSADSYIAENLRALGGMNATILLRLGAEMNNWEECDPAVFIQAFQKIASAARQYSNIQTVFSPDMINNRAVTVEQYYPGDQYVDWVGMSVYHRSNYAGYNGSNSSYTMEDTSYGENAYYGQGIYDTDPLVGIQHIVEVAAAHNKPVMISECGFPYYSGSEDTTAYAVDQLTKFYSYVNMLYPQVKAVFYFDIPREIEVYHYGLSGSSTLNSAYTSAIRNNGAYLSEVNGSAVNWERLDQSQGLPGKVKLAVYAPLPGVVNASVQYFVDGNPVGTVNQAPYYLELDTASWTSGQHTVHAVVTGNQFSRTTPTYTVNLSGGGSAPVQPDQPQQPASQEPSGWAKVLIEEAAEKGLITERTEGLYKEQITRLQFSELAVNLIEKATGKEIEPAENTFDDTDDVMALKAVAAGVAFGKGEGKFAPDAKITRQEICVMLSKVIEYVDAANGSTTLEDTSTELNSEKFHDTSDVASWAKTAVALLTNNELMSGSNGGIAPKANTTVEQAIILALAHFNRF